LVITDQFFSPIPLVQHFLTRVFHCRGLLSVFPDGMIPLKTLSALTVPSGIFVNPHSHPRWSFFSETYGLCPTLLYQAVRLSFSQGPASPLTQFSAIIRFGVFPPMELSPSKILFKAADPPYASISRICFVCPNRFPFSFTFLPPPSPVTIRPPSHSSSLPSRRPIPAERSLFFF